MEKKVTAIIYCRVSSKEQTEGTSLTTQEAQCRSYCEQNGIKVLEVFLEQGKSAKTANRAELIRALAFCKSHRVSRFVVYKIDRFARNQDDHILIRAKLRRYGTELRSITEPIDASPMGQAMEGFLSVFAQLDNDMRSERVTAGMRERLAQGVWMWQAPLGYHRKAGENNISPDPITSPLIRLAFEEYSTGFYSCKRLARFLAARGLRTQSGILPTANGVNFILHNPIYCGIIARWDEVRVGSFKPVISRELFDRCQIILRKERSAPAPRSFTNELFPLRGFVVCVECGRPLTGSRSRGRSARYSYYHHYKRDCGKARSVPKATLEQTFNEFLGTLAFDERTGRQLRDVLVESWARQSATAENDNAVIRREITMLKGDLQSIFDLHRSGVYSDTDLIEQRRLIERRIKEKSRLLIQESGLSFDMERALTQVIPLLRDPVRLWGELRGDYRAQVMMQQMLVPSGRITYDGRRLRTDDIALTYELAAAVSGDNFDVVGLVSSRWNQLISELQNWIRLIRN